MTRLWLLKRLYSKVSWKCNNNSHKNYVDDEESYGYDNNVQHNQGRPKRQQQQLPLLLQQSAELLEEEHDKESLS